MGFLKPVAASEGGPSVEKLPPPDTISAECVVLFEYLTLTRWDNGSARQRSTLTVFVEDGHWKVALNDRENDRVAFMSGDSMSLVIVALEAALRTDSVDWRTQRAKDGTRGRGRNR